MTEEQRQRAKKYPVEDYFNKAAEFLYKNKGLRVEFLTGKWDVSLSMPTELIWNITYKVDGAEKHRSLLETLFRDQTRDFDKTIKIPDNLPFEKKVILRLAYIIWYYATQSGSPN